LVRNVPGNGGVVPTNEAPAAVGHRVHKGDVPRVAVGRVVDPLGLARMVRGIVGGEGVGEVGRPGAVGEVVADEDGRVAVAGGVVLAVAVVAPDLHVEGGVDLRDAVHDLVDVAELVAGRALEGADAQVRGAVEVEVQHGRPAVGLEDLGDRGHVG